MAKLIGLAGHVDHGKTTLVKALTGIDADRLPEEKRRGMTIDIGFAYIELPRSGRVSVVDVPGHEKFIHNMLVGALGVSVALLCVAADEGVKAQTREHLAILDVLPVERLVVALTRCDLVDAETLELARLDAMELLETSRFKEAPVLAVSAVAGTGLEALREALDAALESCMASTQGPWHMPIDRVFAVKGHGLVVTGTMGGGSARKGELAVLQPAGREVRIRGIQCHSRNVDVAEIGQRAALNLAGVDIEDLHRGMAVGDPRALLSTRIFDGNVRWLAVPKHGSRVRVSIGAEEAIGQVFLSGENQDRAQFRLDRPIAITLNQPFVVRRYSPMTLAGGGTVIVPVARPRRKGATLPAEIKDDVIEAIADALARTPEGLPTEELARQIGRASSALSEPLTELKRSNRALGFVGLWLSPAGFEESAERLLQALQAMHRERPTQASHPKERVVERAKLPWSGKSLDRIAAHLAEQGRLAIEGSSLRDPGFRVGLSGRQAELLERVKQEIGKSGVNVPSPADLARMLNVPPQAVDEIVRLGLQTKDLVRIADGIVYTRHQIESFRVVIAELSKGGPFAASDFRDKTQSSRKYVIPLLEYFDSIRVTMRQGDKRVSK